MTSPNTIPNNTNTDAAELATRVHNLPPELFNRICNLTFSTVETNKEHVHITPTYKPPSRLHVSRDTRKTFAKTYYRNKTFQFGDRSRPSDPKTLNKWLTALPVKHAHHLRRVDYHSPGVTDWEYLTSITSFRRDAIAAQLAPELRKASLMLRAVNFLWVYLGHVPYTFRLKGSPSSKQWKLVSAVR